MKLRTDHARDAHGALRALASWHAEPVPGRRLARGVAAVAVLAAVAWPAPAVAGTCRKTASGACIRWYDTTVHWTAYIPTAAAVGSTTAITDAAFLADAAAAVQAWQDQTCALCSAPGPGGTCVAEACDPNPLGITFAFDGVVDDSRLATDCKAVADGKGGYSAKGCPAAAAGSAQIALIRDAAAWPLSAKVVSGTVITSDKAGRLVDADVLVRDNGHVLCTAACTTEQYRLRSVLLQEVGHMLGVGFTDDSIAYLAANLRQTRDVAPTIGTSQVEEACTLYRTSTIPDACTIPAAVAVQGCATGGPRPGPAGAAGPAALLGCLGLAWAVARRRRAS